MNRRQFLVKSGVAVGAATALAGCTSTGQAPPRQSEVFQAIDIQGNTLVVDLEETPVVETRAESSGKKKKKSGGKKKSLGGISLSALSPVGVASAAKGRGMSGGARSVNARGRNGRAKWHGGGYAAWRRDHEDEIEEERSAIPVLGLAFLGTLSMDEDNLPGAGKPPEGWDKTWDEQDLSGQTIEYDGVKTGWWRVGANLRDIEDGHDYGYEAVDFQLKQSGTGYDIDNEWKVSPRL